MKAIVISEKQLLAGQFKQILGAPGDGWQVIWSQSAAEAASEIDNHSLVVLDCEGDGVTGMLRDVQCNQGFNDAPILLVGGKGDEAGLRRGVAAGASGYVLRPLEEGVVRAKVGEVTRPVGGKQHLDVKLVNPFIEAALDVFRTASGMEIRRKDLFLKKNYRMFGDVSGVMGLSGEASGSVVISMPARLACEVVGRMLGEEPEAEVSEIVRDGIGEVINMIAGRAKAVLAGSEYHYTLSLPAVIVGHGHEIAHRSGAPCIVVIFEAGSDEFAIQVSLAPEE